MVVFLNMGQIRAYMNDYFCSKQTFYFFRLVVIVIVIVIIYVVGKWWALKRFS